MHVLGRKYIHVKLKLWHAQVIVFQRILFISQRVCKLLFCIMCLEITLLKLLSHLPGTTDLISHKASYRKYHNFSKHEPVGWSFLITLVFGPRHLPLCGEHTDNRWIPHAKGQQRGNCFHLMTSSWVFETWWDLTTRRLIGHRNSL